jgi:hypothetical protein
LTARGQPHYRSRVRRLGLTLLLAVALTGCGRIARTKQCVLLVRTVNTAIDEIETRRDAGAGDPGTERGIADRYELLAKDLEELELDAPNLAKIVSEYRELMVEIAQATRRSADARERDGAKAAAQARREIGNLSRREKSLAMRIDSSCESP